MPDNHVIMIRINSLILDDYLSECYRNCICFILYFIRSILMKNWTYIQYFIGCMWVHDLTVEAVGLYASASFESIVLHASWLVSSSAKFHYNIFGPWPVMYVPCTECIWQYICTMYKMYLTIYSFFNKAPPPNKIFHWKYFNKKLKEIMT